MRSLVVDNARGRAGSAGARRRDSEARARVRLRDVDGVHAHAGYFVQLGFSIVPHTWVPEKIEADCRTCSQFRHCGQYAVMLPLIRTQACCPDRPYMPEATTVRDLTVTPVHGGVTHRLGLPVCGCIAGSRPANALDLTVIAPMERLRGGTLHDEPRAGRSGARVEAAPRAHGWRRASHRRQQRLRERLHRRSGMSDATRWRPTSRRIGAIPSSPGRIDRRHRRQPEDGPRLAGIRGAVPRSPAARAARPRAPS